MSQRKLEVVWVGDTKDFDKSVNKVGKASDKTGGKLGKLAGMAKVGAVAVGGALVAGAVKCVGAFEESEKVAAQTAAVLKSTGGAANVTADDIGNLATAISKKSGLDDEAVQSGENLLLTFTNIRNEAGRGNDIFNQTSNVMADMSVALGQDMKSSALQLGKALNDPVKGVTALQRVGVSFTQKQRDQIKALVDSGKTMDAQKLILHELTKEFGGSAEAAGSTFEGRINKLKVAFGNLQEKIGGKLVVGLTWLMDNLPKLGSTISGFVDGLMPKFSGFFDGSGAKAKGLASSVSKNFDSIKSSVSDIVKVVGPIVEKMFEFWLAVEKRVLPGLIQSVKGAFEVIRGIVEVVAGILTLDFSKFWDGVKHIFGGALNAIVGGIRQMTAPMREAASRIMGALVHGVESLGGNLFSAAKGRADAILSGIRSIIDDVTQAGRSVISHVAQGIGDAATNLYSAAKGRVDAVVSGVRSILDDVAQAGRSIVSHVASGIAAAGSNLYEAGVDRAKAVVSGVRSLFDDVAAAGRELIGKFAAGIRSAVKWVEDAVNRVLGPIKHMIHVVSGAPGFVKKKLGLAQGGVVRAAQGGMMGFPQAAFASGGFVMARVGELGPETVALPVGARVTQASESTPPGNGIAVTVNNYGERLNEEMVASLLAFKVATS